MDSMIQQQAGSGKKSKNLTIWPLLINLTLLTDANP